MKVNKEHLRTVLDVVQVGLASKEMIEQSASFVFLDGFICTFNDEISVRCPLKGLDFEGAVNAKEFYDFVKKTKVEEIKFEVIDKELIAKAGRSRAGFTLQSEITLALDEVSGASKWIELPPDFIDGLSLAKSVCGRDMTRPLLTSCHITGTYIEGSDGYCFARHSFKEPLKIKDFLLPASVANQIISFHVTHLSQKDGWVHFKVQSGAIVSCRIFQEDYVNLDAFISKKGIALTFPDDILDMIDRSGAFSKRDLAFEEFLDIYLKDGKIEIKTFSEKAWYKEKADTNYKGDDIMFKATPTLLTKILNKTTKAKYHENRLTFLGKSWIYVAILRKF